MTLTTGRSAEAPRPAAGFTLLELVLVLLLISLVMALAVPSLRGFLIGRKSADAVAQVLALAQYARAQAVSTGVAYRLNVDPAKRTYWLTVQKGAAFTDLGTEFGRRFSLPELVEASWLPSAGGTPQEYIDFFPDGRSAAARLRLVDRQGRAFELGARSETEQVTVLPGDKK